ncbi:MMPL family transporter [Nocardia cyriacigeorgica]|uniref:MMPL family transporter n=1 Tax=Nocardia cyriacigeorgica TaxID=135487 RepID=UPI0018955627|nr:MMPL family transporter [Nocardia cyriacigeorgica]MBF6415366.1 MMPL family transporter [Nocardia cyriacigeorgica]
MRTGLDDDQDAVSVEPGTGRSGIAAAWARMCYRFRWPLAAVWLLVAVVGGIQFDRMDKHLRLPDYSISGSDSSHTAAVLGERFPRLGAEQAAVVVTGADGASTLAAVGAVTTALRDIDGIGEMVGPTTPQVGRELIADDRRTAMILIPLHGTVAARDSTTDRIDAALRRIDLTAGTSAELTGETPLNKALADVERRDQVRAEIVGMTLALVVLLWGLKSVLGTILAIASAALGVTLSSIGIAGISGIAETSQFALVVATIIGLAVGVDYALFMISRFREHLPARSEGKPSREQVITALSVCMKTSGHTVIVSGAIVMVSLCSILIIDGPVFRDIAVAAALVVLCSLLAAVTGLPALLVLSASRLRINIPRAGRKHDGRWYRWVAFVQRRPALLGIPAAAVLIALSIPAAGMRLGLDLGIPALADTSAGAGYAAAAQAFGGSAVAPIYVTACADDGSPLRDDQVAAIRDHFEGLPNTAGVSSAASVFDILTGPAADAGLSGLTGTPAGAAADGVLVDDVASPACLLGVVQSAASVDAPETIELVQTLRANGDGLSQAGVTVGVGGMAALYHDIAAETGRMFPAVVLLVLAVSLIYLVVTLRSVVIPVKAIILNALATAASLGATVAVFQYGYGEALFGFDSVGTIQAFLPVAMFAVLFGLSMDYEVFMVQRVREEYLNCGDNREAVRRAMAATAPQITAAGLIMIAVFGSLTVAEVLELKQIGFGLAIAIAIDITVMRLILVPVLMSVADSWNWWLPFQKKLSANPENPQPLREVTDSVAV